MAIFLTGYRGSGKSTVGKLLAAELSREFRDSDDLIVARAGMSIKEIFASKGEAAFRDLESQIIAELALLDEQVIALGGGALMRQENRDALQRGNHTIIYLCCDPAELHRRIQTDPATQLNRPSLTHLGGTLEEIQRLLSQREPIYLQTMTAQVDVTRLTPQQAVAQILPLL